MHVYILASIPGLSIVVFRPGIHCLGVGGINSEFVSKILCK